MLHKMIGDFTLRPIPEVVLPKALDRDPNGSRATTAERVRRIEHANHVTHRLFVTIVVRAHPSFLSLSTAAMNPRTKFFIAVSSSRGSCLLRSGSAPTSV